MDPKVIDAARAAFGKNGPGIVLGAVTPDDEKAMRAAARTFPKTAFYEIEQILTSLGTGQALVTVLTPSGVPTPPFATMMVPPAASMSPLSDADMVQQLAKSPQVREYSKAVDRESAREILAERATRAAVTRFPVDDAPTGSRTRGAKQPTSALDRVLKSSMARTVVGVVARGIMGALLGTAVRRRRT